MNRYSLRSISHIHLFHHLEVLANDFKNMTSIFVLFKEEKGGKLCESSPTLKAIDFGTIAVTHHDFRENLRKHVNVTHRL